MRSLFYIFVSFALLACVDQQSSPEASIKSIVEGRVGTVVTREFILERVTGKMKESFENMSEEDFQKFADLRNVKKNSFKVLSKSCQEKKCFVTYSVSYTSLKDGNNVFHTEVKKIAEVLMLEGRWLIADVSNIKTYHEALEPISPLE